MAKTVSGSFDVKLTPRRDGNVDGVAHGRMAIEKTYHGDLAATGIGEMLALRTPVEGSAGYVALELVRGILQGRNGSFVLQHSGMMARGAQQLSVSVVADSGTEELRGLTGVMDIQITDGKHAYSFVYSLP